MSKALIAGINQVATDKGLDREVIFDAIEASLISAYKRNYGSIANISAEVDRASGEMRIFTEKEVVEEIFNDRTEITLGDANRIAPTAQLGDVIKAEHSPENFGRIAAQTAKQVILQRIREAERDIVYENFAHRVGELINGQVRSVDTVSGAVTLLLDDKHECLIMREDRIPNERLRRGDYLKVYVVDVHRSTRGPVIKLSRTHRNLLKRLMEQEIPEIRDGVVDIKAIAREPGARSKAAVVATMPGVDPVGSCVGMRGLRIQNIVNELGGEKIDVVEWSTDLFTYISNALSPAKVDSVWLDEKNPIKTAVVIVPDRQLSLAIGKAGQNARLAAKLTGWRIDIKSESEVTSDDLDGLVNAQSLVRPAGNDLLSYAEELLRAGDESGSDSADDRLREAARLVEETSSSSESGDEFDLDTLPPLIELPSEEKPDPQPSSGMSFEEAAAAVSDEPEFVEDFPIFESTEELASLNLGIDVNKLQEQEEPEPEEDLPELITADMLQSKKEESAQEQSAHEDDFEIPAELLIGLDEDITLDDLAIGGDEKKSKKSKDKKVKSKSKGKKSNKKASSDGLEDLEDFF
ncbi:MAG: transcription termination factor NusA [Chloroflexota bacterium]